MYMMNALSIGGAALLLRIAAKFERGTLVVIMSRCFLILLGLFHLTPQQQKRDNVGGQCYQTNTEEVYIGCVCGNKLLLICIYLFLLFRCLLYSFTTSESGSVRAREFCFDTWQ